MITDLADNEYIDGNVLKASAKDRTVLILRHLSSPVKRFDRKRVSYQLELRELSVDLDFACDAVCCVKFNEFSYWSKRELDKLKALEDHASLFDCFDML